MRGGRGSHGREQNAGDDPSSSQGFIPALTPIVRPIVAMARTRRGRRILSARPGASARRFWRGAADIYKGCPGLMAVGSGPLGWTALGIPVVRTDRGGRRQCAHIRHSVTLACFPKADIPCEEGSNARSELQSLLRQSSFTQPLRHAPDLLIIDNIIAEHMPCLDERLDRKSRLQFKKIGQFGTQRRQST